MCTIGEVIFVSILLHPVINDTVSVSQNRDHFFDDIEMEQSVYKTVWFTYHGLHKLLYKPVAKVMGNGDFRPPTAAKPLDRL